jgi:hypothetical protein
MKIEVGKKYKCEVGFVWSVICKSKAFPDWFIVENVEGCSGVVQPNGRTRLGQTFLVSEVREPREVWFITRPDGRICSTRYSSAESAQDVLRYLQSRRGTFYKDYTVVKFVEEFQ